jgi:hypothetical protein
MNSQGKVFKVLLFPLLVVTLAFIFPNSAVPALYQISPTEDALVQSGTLYENTNYGDADYLRVGYSTSGSTWRSYLKFDLDIPSMPDNEYITSLTLNLYQDATSGESGDTVHLYWVGNDSWSEATVTWVTRPGLTEQLTSTTTGDGWNAWTFSPPSDDSTPDILSLGLGIDELTNYHNDFNSKEYSDASYRPNLEVTTAVIPLPGSLLLLGTGLISLGAVGWRKPWKD